jgi:flagellar protein FliO/FliZ
MDTPSPAEATLLFDFIKMLAALGFVIALMLSLSYILKRIGVVGVQDSGGHLKLGKKRLSISESLVLGPKQRLALIKCDDTEHLVILGLNGDTVIETNINPPEARQSDTTAKKTKHAKKTS